MDRDQQKQEDRIATLEKQMTTMLEMLKPISETYTTVSFLGKWMMAFAVFISILLGIVLSVKTFFAK